MSSYIVDMPAGGELPGIAFLDEKRAAPPSVDVFPPISTDRGGSSATWLDD